jgi:hypothetical protein
MPTVKELAAAQAEQGAKIDALIELMTAQAQAQPSGVEVEATPAPAPAPAKVSKTTKVKNLDGLGATNHFPASQCERQGGQWVGATAGQTLTYTRKGKNPGSSAWKVTSIDTDGGVFAVKIEG